MGIFSRKVSSRDRELISEEKFKYFSQEIANTTEAEYHRFEELVDERKADGLSGSEFTEYESAVKTSLGQICKFIKRSPGEDSSGLRTDERFQEDCRPATTNQRTAKNG